MRQLAATCAAAAIGALLGALFGAAVSLAIEGCGGERPLPADGGALQHADCGGG